MAEEASSTRSGREEKAAAPARSQAESEKSKNDRILLCIMLAAVLLSTIYWIAFCINAYNNFNEFADLGGFTMSMYYDIHYPAIAHGWQFISFDNHLAPDMLLILPIYAIWQSPVTLIIVQAIMMCATALLLFLVADDLLHDRLTALLLGLAFLITPGMWYIIMSAFHSEPLVVPLYLLVFYFFMKKDTAKFVVSTIFFLGAMEFSPFLGASLGLGLFIYCFFEPERDMKKIRQVGILLGLSLAAYVFYAIAINGLLAGYANGQYAGLPLTIHALPAVSMYVAPLSSAASNISLALSNSPPLLLFTLAVAFLSFGIAVFYRPITTIILVSPWWVNAIVLANEGFFEVSHYFSLALGGLLVAVLLVLLTLKKKKEQGARAYKVIKYSIICVPLVLFLIAPSFVSQSAFWYSLGETFLFQHTPAQQAAITQLNSVLNLLPPNASVYTTYFVFAHVTQRKDAEAFSPPGWYYFEPDYVLFDFNTTVNYEAYGFNQSNVVLAFLKEYNNSYELYAKNGTSVLLKRVK
jgi:uncharacterized membrane protein